MLSPNPTPNPTPVPVPKTLRLLLPLILTFSSASIGRANGTYTPNALPVRVTLHLVFGPSVYVGSGGVAKAVILLDGTTYLNDHCFVEIYAGERTFDGETQYSLAAVRRVELNQFVDPEDCTRFGWTARNVQTDGTTSHTIHFEFPVVESDNSRIDTYFKVRVNDPGGGSDEVFRTDGSAYFSRGTHNGNLFDTYNSWRNLYFGSNVSNPGLEVSLWGMLADPDMDGMTNIVEFFRATSPLVPNYGSGEQLVELLSPTSLRYVRRKAMRGVTESVVFSPSLEAGSWQPMSDATSSSRDLPDGRQEVTVSWPPSSEGRKFMKLILESQ